MMRKSTAQQRDAGATIAAMPEISNLSLDAWNHALGCKVLASEAAYTTVAAQQMNSGSAAASTPKSSKARAKPDFPSPRGSCTFELCDAVRPSVHHRIKVEKQGIVGRCLEGCRHCEFFMRMKAEVAADLCPKASRLETKKNKLVQQFAGLLLAHLKEGEGSPVELYNHVMKCELYDPAIAPGTEQLSPASHCAFRNATGSCRSSMELLAHRCVANKKQCPLCSQLPPKLRRMTRKQSAMPNPFALERARPSTTKRRRRQFTTGTKRRIDETPDADTTQPSATRSAPKSAKRSAGSSKRSAAQVDESMSPMTGNEGDVFALPSELSAGAQDDYDQYGLDVLATGVPMLGGTEEDIDTKHGILRHGQFHSSNSSGSGSGGGARMDAEAECISDEVLRDRLMLRSNDAFEFGLLTE
jgi:hypothetical protein